MRIEVNKRGTLAWRASWLRQEDPAFPYSYHELSHMYHVDAWTKASALRKAKRELKRRRDLDKNDEVIEFDV